MKKILCLDFDGVIHSYVTPWRGADVIPDPPVPGALDFLLEALDTFDVQIYSTRSWQEGGIGAMYLWLERVSFEAFPDEPDKARKIMTVKFPKGKPAAFVTLDDRAINFDGKWPSIKWLADFVPWNRVNLNLPTKGEPNDDSSQTLA